MSRNFSSRGQGEATAATVVRGRFSWPDEASVLVSSERVVSTRASRLVQNDIGIYAGCLPQDGDFRLGVRKVGGTPVAMGIVAGGGLGVGVG